MKIAVTGSNGFIGKNLIYNLINSKKYEILKINRKTKRKLATKYLLEADVICHFAGVNRPKKNKTFKKDNINFTKYISKILEKNNKPKKIIFSSSIHANLKNNYGISKLKCEKILISCAKKYNFSLINLRIPNVFGKWCKPNYNSVIATFCNNIARKKKIKILDPNKIIRLIYIDDLVSIITKFINKKNEGISTKIIKSTKAITIKKLSDKINKFELQRKNLHFDSFEDKFEKDLYSTYISHLPSRKISYKLMKKTDRRGSFVEFFKNNTIGQFSIFTAKKKQIRGNHFHHSKVEKFFVLKGEGKFYMKDISSKRKITFKLNGNNPKIVESIPGWQHYIENIGNDDLIVILWSNEVFNKNKPDTFSI